MKDFLLHLRMYIFRGLLAIIPILLCLLAVQLLYVLIDQRVMGFFAKYFDLRQIPGMGIILLLLSLYFIGLIVSSIIGRQLFRFIDHISNSIPLIKIIYGVGKQLSQSLAVADDKKQAFKKAVLVKVNEGLFAPAFVMNSFTDTNSKEEMYFVLIPTSPTPASGFVTVVKVSQTIDPGWSIEECLKAVVSVGIVTPANTKI
jgi:uncharacterized membrane protein